VKYLKGTIERGPTYRKVNKPLVLQGYSNVDWARDVNTKRFTLGYSFLALMEL
jgi:hypothetical protein